MSGQPLNPIDLGGYSEGFDPAWLAALKSSDGMDLFKKTFCKGQTLKKQGPSKICIVHHRVGTSVSGAPEACKFYERNDELAVNRWALEVAIHKTLSGDPHIVK